MSTETEGLLNAALALNEEERFELAEALTASLPWLPPDESFRSMLRRRSQELRDGTVVGVPWEEVKKEGRRIIDG